MASTLQPTRLEVELDGASLALDDVIAVVRGELHPTLSEDAAERMEASRAVKDELIDREVPIYGVTTGFGDSANRQIAPAKAARLQQNLLRKLGCGTGPTAPVDVVRATILLRANCLAKGNSGVRADLVHALLGLLEAGVVPLVPERGSCGASGDLVPLSYVGSALIGEGEVRDGGTARPTFEALAEHGLEPLELEAKEGLALVNGTSFMTAFAALTVADARELAVVTDLATAMASEALLGNRGHFNAFLFEAKPHPGMLESARVIRTLLADSELALDSDQIFAHEDLAGREFMELHRQVQDRYSIRCAPHVNGMLRDTLEWVSRWIEVEINSSDDNPLFDRFAARVHSGGNFYGGHMGQAMDSLKVALANLCDLLDRQLELLVDEKFNGGLTPNLILPVAPDDPEAGLHHGFKGMQLCSSSMTAEALHLSAPATIHSRSTEAHNQDKVSMGTIAARDARSIAELAMNVAAIHLLAAAQALELRGLDRASSAGRAAHALVRAESPFVDGDRRLDRDIRAIVELISSGELSRLVRAATS